MCFCFNTWVNCLFNVLFTYSYFKFIIWKTINEAQGPRSLPEVSCLRLHERVLSTKLKLFLYISLSPMYESIVSRQHHGYFIRRGWAVDKRPIGEYPEAFLRPKTRQDSGSQPEVFIRIWDVQTFVIFKHVLSPSLQLRIYFKGRSAAAQSVEHPTKVPVWCNSTDMGLFPGTAV